MDLLCAVHLSCKQTDHRAEAEEAQRRFPPNLVLKRIANIPPEALYYLKLLRDNRLSLKGNIYAFLSGSLLIECRSREDACGALSSLARAELAEVEGGLIYLPNTVLNDKLLEHLPLDIDEEGLEIKKAYVASVSGINNGEGIAEALADYLRDTGRFMGENIDKVLSNVSFIPHLINKYINKIDILIKLKNNDVIGVNYTDIRKSIHLGFSTIENYLMYGLDYVLLLHPYINHNIHKSISNKIKDRYISDTGYIVIDLINELIYIYKMPHYNKILSKYISIHSIAKAIRSYIESL
ncbi:MAG: hypothetical protein JZD41_03160 [Thermoproteus sp.]|nr:hypothetical protein [Thermoproteus sp.]